MIERQNKKIFKKEKNKNFKIVLRDIREQINKRLEKIEKKTLNDLDQSTTNNDKSKTKNTTVIRQFQKAHREPRTLFF